MSPKVSSTGRCYADCRAFILTALEDERKDAPKRKSEVFPVDEEQLFVDRNREKGGPEEIRFGMKDARGKIHFFCMYKVEPILEYEVHEIYPEEDLSHLDKERTWYCFRTFGYRKPDEILIADLLEKLDTALRNPVIKAQ